MIETEEQLQGTPLAPDRSFNFECRPGLACFNTCCRDKRLPLWPYDLLRLRQGLDLSSDAILEQYVELEQDPNSGWPALRLRLEEGGRCPFVGSGGCRVYSHRPTACRIYPLARAVSRKKGGRDEIFLRQNTKGCLGFNQSKAHTTSAWVKDQGLEEYFRVNNQFHTLWFHPRRQGKLKLSPRQTHGVILAVYNIDVLRQMTSGSGFKFDRTGLKDPGGLDDLELLFWGRDFLIWQLFS